MFYTERLILVGQVRINYRFSRGKLEDCSITHIEGLILAEKLRILIE